MPIVYNISQMLLLFWNGQFKTLLLTLNSGADQPTHIGHPPEVVLRRRDGLRQGERVPVGRLTARRRMLLPEAICWIWCHRFKVQQTERIHLSVEQ